MAKYKLVPKEEYERLRYIEEQNKRLLLETNIYITIPEEEELPDFPSPQLHFDYDKETD